MFWGRVVWKRGMKEVVERGGVKVEVGGERGWSLGKGGGEEGGV